MASDLDIIVNLKKLVDDLARAWKRTVSTFCLELWAHYYYLVYLFPV
jgi:hypothetical protein